MRLYQRSRVLIFIAGHRRDPINSSSGQGRVCASSSQRTSMATDSTPIPSESRVVCFGGLDSCQGNKEQDTRPSVV